MKSIVKAQKIENIFIVWKFNVSQINNKIKDKNFIMKIIEDK